MSFQKSSWKLVWEYGSQHKGSPSVSNIDILKRFQSKTKKKSPSEFHVLSFFTEPLSSGKIILVVWDQTSGVWQTSYFTLELCEITFVWPMVGL